MAAKNQIDSVRRNIEKSIELAEEERKRKLQVQRLEYARAGIFAFKNRRIGEAVRGFQGYIKTMEELKGVGEGGLLPSHFDVKKDTQELLMISAIYWDMAKLFDRTRTKGKRKEMQHYLEKYVQFSNGMPFQPLCAETVRKYISSDKAVHRSDFSHAYKVLGTRRCFIATSLIDVISEDTLPSLEKYRDEVLNKSKGGRLFITWYYKNGPGIADKIRALPRVCRIPLGASLDWIARKVAARSAR